MKKQIQSIRFFLFATLLIAGFSVSANNNVTTFNDLNLEESYGQFFDVFNYSWTAESGAVTYTLNLVNTATQESFTWETAVTSVSSFSVPNGVYEVTVEAKFSNNNSFIIVEDMIIH